MSMEIPCQHSSNSFNRDVGIIKKEFNFIFIFFKPRPVQHRRKILILYQYIAMKFKFNTHYGDADIAELTCKETIFVQATAELPHMK